MTITVLAIFIRITRLTVRVQVQCFSCLQRCGYRKAKESRSIGQRGNITSVRKQPIDPSSPATDFEPAASWIEIIPSTGLRGLRRTRYCDYPSVLHDHVIVWTKKKQEIKDPQWPRSCRYTMQAAKDNSTGLSKANSYSYPLKLLYYVLPITLSAINKDALLQTRD